MPRYAEVAVEAARALDRETYSYAVPDTLDVVPGHRVTVPFGRRATYGASPGDRHHDEPYLYASPWAGRIDGYFDHPQFKGASLLYSQLEREDHPEAAALAFLREARRRILSYG